MGPSECTKRKDSLKHAPAFWQCVSLRNLRSRLLGREFINTLGSKPEIHTVSMCLCVCVRVGGQCRRGGEQESRCRRGRFLFTKIFVHKKKIFVHIHKDSQEAPITSHPVPSLLCGAMAGRRHTQICYLSGVVLTMTSVAVCSRKLAFKIGKLFGFLKGKRQGPLCPCCRRHSRGWGSRV